MPRSLTLTIPQPCHESWAAMTPAAQGRHCAACAKTVVDFSCMTDAQVVAFLSQASGGSCGRFRAEQLGRPLRATTEAPVSRWWLATVLAVAGLGAAAPAVAQKKSAAPKQEQIILGKTAVPAAALPKRIIRGQVMVAGTDEWLPGVTVLVKGTAIGTSTNADGNFELQVPLAPDTHLMFSSIGYFTQQVALADFEDQSISIRLTVDEKALGEQIVTGGYCAPRWYTPRSLWQRLTRPFRR